MINKLHVGRCLASVATTILISPALAQPVVAQADSPPKPVSTADDASSSIGDIIVTAQRRSENLQRTPIAVTALSNLALEQRSIVDSYDLMKVAPGLQVATQTSGNGGGSATFFLRGLGQERAGAGSEPAVGIYIDDFYYPTVQGAVFSILDLSQVEVLRGPQGTLFGRNTIGGAIRYTTAKPTQDFGGSVTGTLGSYGRKDIVGVLNVPLTSTTAVRLTGGRLDRDGYVKRTAVNGKKAGGSLVELARGQIESKPTDNLDIRLVASHLYQDLDGFTQTFGPILPRPGTLPFVYNLQNPGNPYDSRYNSQCTYCQDGTRPGFSTTKTDDANATVALDLADHITLKSLTSWTKVHTYSQNNLNGSPLQIFIFAPGTEDSRAFSQEVQLNGSIFDNRLKFTSGLYYFRNRRTAQFDYTIILGPRVPQPKTPGETITKSKAAYIDTTFDLTDALKIIAGVRFSKDVKDLKIISLGAGGGPDVITPAHGEWPSTTPRFGLQYQLNRDVMAYASVSKGFRGGGFNSGLVSGRVVGFDPESLWSYEGGMRTELFNRVLRLNPTVFYSDYSGVQIQSAVLNPNGTVTAALSNAGRAHMYGFELEAEAALGPHLRLFGNLATLHARYDDVGSATEITLKSKFQRAPKLTYSIGSTYSTAIGDDYHVSATANFSWQGTQRSAPSDLYSINLPSYGLLNLRAELRSPNDVWSLALFVTNLTNKPYYVGAVDYSVNVGTLTRDIGRPREFGSTLRFKF